MLRPARLVLTFFLGVALLVYVGVRAKNSLLEIRNMRNMVAEQHRLIIRLTDEVAGLEAERQALLEQLTEIQWGTRITESPEKLVVAFMDAYKNRSGTLARMYLTAKVREQIPMRPLGTDNPFISRYELLTPSQPTVGQDSVQFSVRVFEEYTGMGEIGYFDLFLTVVQSNYRFLIDGIKQGQYVQLGSQTGRSGS